MKIANVKGRASLVLGDEIADVPEVSGGCFGPDLMGICNEYRHDPDPVHLTA